MSDVPDATKWVDELRGGDETEQEQRERELNDVLTERDDAEDYIDALLDEVLGPDRAEWSSAYGRADALEEVRERIAQMLKPSIDKAWNRFEAALEQQAEPEQEPVAWIDEFGNVFPLGAQRGPKYLNEPMKPLYTAPPKPAQDLIVGYADSHDIARDGHDFWVSRQPGKNTVPLYLYGYPPKIWQGLTDEERYLNDCRSEEDIEYARAIEAKLKEKNT